MSNSSERTKIVKHLMLFVTLLVALGLVACGPLPTSTTPPPAPTDIPRPTPSPIPQTAAPAEPGEPTEPGGVEIALALVTIPDQEVIARVNGEDISTAFYQAELERALSTVTNQYQVDWNDTENQSYLPGFQEQVLDQLIDRALLRQLASQENIAIDPAEVETEIASIQIQIEQDETIADWASFLAENNLTDEIVRELVTDDLIMEALTERHGGSSLVEQVHASHILVETEETGQEVLDKLAAGEDFAALAAEYSIDPGSKDQGGDLDWFPRGMMVPEFEEAAFSLEPNETSGLVQTDFGYHIILVHEKGEREMDPTLYAQVQQQQFQTWYQAQQSEANIERLFTFQESE
jgi:foldase protein PrsA